MSDFLVSRHLIVNCNTKDLNRLSLEMMNGVGDSMPIAVEQQETNQRRDQMGFVSTIDPFGGTKDEENITKLWVNQDNAYGRRDHDTKTMFYRKRPQVTAHPGCDCEFQYRDYIWKKFTEYAPSRNGVELREFYVVSQSGREYFTYAEGPRTENRFPYVCGEIVSTKRLASASKLNNMHAWVQMSPEEASSYTCAGSEVRPLHVQQRDEDNIQRTLISLPLTVDKRSKVIVFRTHGESLFVQLMPTLHSEHKLISGTPLFDKNNRGIRAVVGNMFSQNDYVINCMSNEFCEIPIYKNKHGSDRLRIVCLDRRGVETNVKKSHASSVLSLVSMGVEAIAGGPTETAGKVLSLPSDDGSASALENEIIYSGVVNEKFQVTDSFTVDKKNKSPKSVVTVLIDDNGVSVQYVDDTDRAVFKWINADARSTYSIMPRRFFNAKASVVAINTARNSKKEPSLKRFKSQERLI